MLEIRHIRLLTELASGKTLSAVSESLGCTQSALSHQLREAERRLGIQLTVRAGKVIQLNPAAAILVEFGKVMLAQLKRAEEDATLLATRGDQRIRISTECYTCYHWLPPLVLDAQKGLPSVNIDIAIEATQNPLQALLDKTIDVAIVSTDVVDRRLAFRKLFLDEWVVVLAPSHRLSKKATVRPDDLVDETYVGLAAPGASDFGSLLFKPEAKRMRVGLSEAVLGLVNAGAGVSVLPRWICSGAEDAGKVISKRIWPKGVFREWKIVYRADTDKEGVVPNFINILAKFCSSKTYHV
jgi:LysR family transcriptional regulator for metE and metH